MHADTHSARPTRGIGSNMFNLKIHQYRALLAALVIAVSSGAGMHMTDAAFTTQARNPSNLFSSGTVLISNNSGGVTVSATGLKPNETRDGCIQVTYTGSVPANVRIHATTSGTLVNQLNVTITKGTVSSGAFPSCANFTPDDVVYSAGQPRGLVWTGALSSFPSSWASGIVDPVSLGTAATWTNPTTEAYKFEFTTADSATVANKTASIGLNFEAQNT